jgi:hypothetical protein
VQQYLNLLEDYGFADSAGDPGKPKHRWAVPPEGCRRMLKTCSLDTVRQVGEGVLSCCP